MKAIICGIAGGIQLYTPGVEGQLGSPLGWHKCPCGLSAAKWLDPEKGTIAVAARRDRGLVRGLGLNNQLLMPAFAARERSWETFRAWHDAATTTPGYVFDKARAACWAVPFVIGTTSDSRWATAGEFEEAFVM